MSTPGRATPVDAAGDVCEQCGEERVAEAAFCEACGAAVATPVAEEGTRDHFRLNPASWVAGVCDRGIDHRRNDDAMALAADEPPGSHAALVVCDGVSTAQNSDVASLAAARAALAILAAPFSQGVGGPDSALVAGRRTFERAVREAQAAVIREAEGFTKPGACTFVAAVLSGDTLWHAAVGDSRVYLIPDEGTPLMLTTDDSMAEMLIATGMAREAAERTPIAHTITRWLGPDAPDLDPHAGRSEINGPSWVIVCSDGLWNYASEAEKVADVLRQTVTEVGDGPEAVAAGLVQWANDQGGQDNITVAVARVGDR